jgi:hypothetical protein
VAHLDDNFLPFRDQTSPKRRAAVQMQASLNRDCVVRFGGLAELLPASLFFV